MSTPVEGDPRTAGSPPAVIDRRPFQTAMLGLLLSGPASQRDVTAAGINAVPWNEAMQAYDVYYQYRTNRAERDGIEPPPYETENIVRRVRGAGYMIGKYFNQLKSRGAFELRDGLVYITDTGREMHKNPDPKPYMSKVGSKTEDVDGKPQRKAVTVLPDETVMEIRRRYADGEPPAMLSDAYSLPRHSIHTIVRGSRHYSHLPLIPRTPEGEARAEELAKESRRNRLTHQGKRLTDEKVMEIRRRYANGETPATISEEEGIIPSTLQKMLRGESYAHLPVLPRHPELDAIFEQRTIQQQREARQRSGASFPNEIVMEIRNLYAEGAIAHDLARRYDVGPSTIKKIVSGATYPHLPMVERSPEAEARARARQIEAHRESRQATGHSLKDEEVIEIRERWADGELVTELAEEFDVTQGTMGGIVNGDTYTYLPVIARDEAAEQRARDRTVVYRRRQKRIKAKQSEQDRAEENKAAVADVLAAYERNTTQPKGTE